LNFIFKDTIELDRLFYYFCINASNKSYFVETKAQSTSDFQTLQISYLMYDKQFLYPKRNLEGELTFLIKLGLNNSNQLALIIDSINQVAMTELIDGKVKFSQFLTYNEQQLMIGLSHSFPTVADLEAVFLGWLTAPMKMQLPNTKADSFFGSLGTKYEIILGQTDVNNHYVVVANEVDSSRLYKKNRQQVWHDIVFKWHKLHKILPWHDIKISSLKNMF
jgi:hypothetical protein